MKRLVILLSLVIFGLIIIFLWWNDATSAVDATDTSPIIFEITSGQTVKEIASQLKKENLIKDPIAFFIYTRLTDIAKKIQAGNFRLNKTMSTQEISEELTHGTTDIWVTLIEGWRKEEIALELAKHLSIPEAEFLAIAQEGFMFPDTYLLPKNATAQSVVDIILNNFKLKVKEDVITKGKQQGLDLNQVITLASIIEREVREDSDRPIIAGILLKRLKEGWPLQTDATIQYALGYQSQTKTWWKKDLTADDLKIVSAYNTYTNTGLPPGPISSPGLSTINAVVNPKQSDYWFYLSDNDGITRYAKTQEEHQKNIEKYLR